MTSPKVATTFVASEVKTLSCGAAKTISRSPLHTNGFIHRSEPPLADLFGSPAGPGTIPVHKRAPRLGRERPQVDRSAEQLTVYPPAVSRTG